MPNNSVKQPTPLDSPPRSMAEERRLFAETMQLLARVFIKLDERRDMLLPGEAQDDFHALAVDATERLDVVALALTALPLKDKDSEPKPTSATLEDHGLTSRI